MKKLCSALLVTAFAISISSTVSYAAPRDNKRIDGNDPKTRQSQTTRKRSDAAPQRPAAQPKPPTQRPSATANPQTHRAAAPANRPASKPSASTNDTAVHRPTPTKSVESSNNNGAAHRPATQVNGSKSTPRPPRNHNASSNTVTTADKPSSSNNRPAIQHPSVNNPSRAGTTDTQSTTANNATNKDINKRPHLNSNDASKRYIRPSTPREGRPVPRPTHNQQSSYRPTKITNNTVMVANPPRIGAHTRPSKYYTSRSGYARRGNYIVYNNYIVVRPGYISYVYHPLVYYRPLPIYYNPHYYYRYHNYYHGYSDFYILGRLLLAFANAIERNSQQEQIDSLRDDISYLQRKLELQDEQITTNNKEEFYQLLDELGVSRDEVDNYDLESDYLLYGGS